MSNITELIKELRNKSGAGFLDCKNALSENSNDIEKANEYLRKKGLAKASKKTSREAKEGAVGIYESKELVVIIRINSETDFAAKSEIFLSFLDDLGQFALSLNKPGIKKEDFLNLKYNENTVSDYFKSMISKIGENLVLNDLQIIDINNLNYSFYVHNSYKKNIGKIISLILFEANEVNDVINNLSKNICMHIAAMKPDSLDVDDLDKDKIQKEKDIQKELILNSGKPSAIVDKILDGKMKKYFSEVTLLNQSFILDPDKNVKSIIQEQGKENNFDIKSFIFVSLS
tara:strand:+ start:482 stop:1342 length:861 start_codon:yes stop_codon:yes gene_type:complete